MDKTHLRKCFGQRNLPARPAYPPSDRGSISRPFLTQLSLAGSQIGDATLEQLPNWFPELQQLDLGHTKVSMEGLQHVRKLLSLADLGLAGTKLSIADINKLITAGTSIPTVDLSETNFTCDELLLLDSNVTSLTAKNMNLDDQEISKLCQRGWVTLDISGNPSRGAVVSSLGRQSQVHCRSAFSSRGATSFFGPQRIWHSECFLSSLRDSCYS